MASAQLKIPARQSTAPDHRQYYELASRLYAMASQEDDPALLEEAMLNARQAYELKPAYLAGLNLLARIEMLRGHFHSAERWVKEGLRLKPDSASLLYSAGHIALVQNKLNEAEDYFSRSARISRVATKAVNSLAHVKLLQRDYVEAFRHYRELAKTQSRDKQIRSKLFEASAQVAADFYSEELEQDLLRYLDFNDVDYSQLRSLATSLLKHKLRLSEAGCPLEMENIVSDPLLLKCLTRFYFCDPVMERLLITIRQSLLISCSRQLSIRSDELPLVAALAQQCQLNESVWYVSSQEDMLVEQLSLLVNKMLTLADISATDLYPALSLVMMYRPLTSCSFYPALATRRLQWPPLLDGFIRSISQEQKQLHKVSQQLPSFGISTDETSQRVMQQYDENPYPRWLDIGYNQPANYRASLQAAFPAADLTAIPRQHAEVLVAGCGTGRHAIRLAHYFQPLNITAVDLSSTALAYASLQAQKYQTSELTFMQGDLLQIDRIGQQFDVIECSGVLHHMADPLSGLKALSAQLKAGGVMKIALYSRTARQSITALRAMWGQKHPEKPAEMRLIREALLQGSLPGDWKEIYNSPDFYSTSACRDLLFHRQEHTFDIAQLEPFIQQAGLEWIGMLPPPDANLQEVSPGKHPGLISWQEWQQAEQQNPALFAGMYQFYVQKPLRVTAAS